MARISNNTISATISPPPFLHCVCGARTTRYRSGQRMWAL
jgi:hypothetical protein